MRWSYNVFVAFNLVFIMEGSSIFFKTLFAVFQLSMEIIYIINLRSISYIFYLSYNIQLNEFIYPWNYTNKQHFHISISLWLCLLVFELRKKNWWLTWGLSQTIGPMEGFLCIKRDLEEAGNSGSSNRCPLSRRIRRTRRYESCSRRDESPLSTVQYL